MLKQPNGDIITFFECIVADEYRGSFSSKKLNVYEMARKNQLEHIKRIILENKEISNLTINEEIEIYKKFLKNEIKHTEGLNKMKIKWLNYWFEIAKIELNKKVI